MINIPTELLRTLISVVDLRSFTKAARALGVTQPAISAQIKRLQTMLGRELFDKSAPGVTLTAIGQDVVSCARKLLQINDQIIHLVGPRPDNLKLCVGISGDLASAQLPWTLAGFRARWPDVSFEIRRADGEQLTHDLQAGELDLIVTLSDMKSDPEARFQWAEDLMWVRGASTHIEADGVIPLATCGEGCAHHRLVVSTLEQAGRSYRIVFTAPSLTKVAAAVAAGFGVTALIRGLADASELVPCEDRLLPKLPSALCSIRVREGGNREALDQLADGLAAILQPSATASRQFRAGGMFEGAVERRVSES
jgi:DNA-binding transcriptional LysR family regulator